MRVFLRRLITWPAWALTALYVVLCAFILLFILFSGKFADCAEQIQAPPDEQKISRAYRFTGRWVPDESTVSAGGDANNLNFIKQINLRPTGAGTGTSLEGVLGFSKINSTPLSSYPLIRNGHQLYVNATDTASHVLVQARNSTGSSVVYLNSAQIPNPGNFTSTVIHTDETGAGLGRFSTGAGDVVVYSNGVENKVWGGNETRASAFFMVSDATGANPKDYTAAIQTSLDDAANCVSIGTQKFWIVLSTRALQGVRYTVKTANTSTSSVTARAWNGTTFDTVSNFVDGTSVGGKSLAQSGWMSFNSTAGTAQPHHFEGLYFYAYMFELSAGSATISQVVVDAPWQNITDIWDETPREKKQCQIVKGGVSYSYSAETLDESTQQYPVGAYLGGTNSTDYMILLFKDRLSGLRWKFIAGATNSNSSASTSLYTWNGTSWSTPDYFYDGTRNGTESITQIACWTVSNGTDVTQFCSDIGTKNDTATLAQDGDMVWTPPAKEQEFERTMYGSTGYAYKLQWNATLGNSTSTEDASVIADVISGIPAPRPPDVAKFSASYQGRLFLFNFEKSGQANRADFSYPNSPDIWNGEQTSDSGQYSLFYGASSEPIVAAAEIFNRIGNSPNSMLIVYKKNSIYMTIGYDSASEPRTRFVTYQVSESVGCAAPLTLATCEMGYDMAENVQRNLAIWLTYSGPYAFDGMVLQQIQGISSYFNPSEDKCINFSAIENARGWYDSLYKEYNLLIPSGAGQTENNVWLVYDMVRKKWFEKSITSNTTKTPISGFPVVDQYGARYIYAGLRDGYLMRLENGPSWDELPITQTVETGDFFFSDNLFDITTIRYIKLLAARIDEAHTLSVHHVQFCG